MTAGQFWDEDPWLAEAYREAAEYQAQRKSWEMWLQGVYFFNAVSTALGNAFRKKGAKTGELYGAADPDSAFIRGRKRSESGTGKAKNHRLSEPIHQKMGGNTLSVELDTLELKVQSNADQAALKVDKLTSALNNLKGITKGGVGLTTVANQLSKLNGALSGLNINSKKITELKSALSGLSDVQKSTGLTSTINALKKLPQISKELSATDLSKFAGQMTQVANAVRPLASEMEKVSAGFKAFPIRIQKLISSNAGLAASNKTTGKSFGFFGTGISSAITKIGVWYLALRKIASVMAEWINESNSYIENMNLFTVAMGEAAQGAYDYAVQVNKVLGIDTSEWIRNQGVFKQITSGFGIAENDANQMSKVLTQLGYDISSFFNISIEDAMQKVQSGISGELEPLRRLGYAFN